MIQLKQCVGSERRKYIQIYWSSRIKPQNLLHSLLSWWCDFHVHFLDAKKSG